MATMLSTPDGTMCELIRELAAIDDARVPGAMRLLLHEIHDLALGLAHTCDAERADQPAAVPSAIDTATRVAELPAAAATNPFRSGYPHIKSPQILEWDYQGALAGQRQEQSTHAAHTECQATGWRATV